MDIAKSQQYIAAHRDETAENLCRFIVTDTLLFWDTKSDLAAYQQKHWQPILDKLNAVFKLNLQKTTSFTPAENVQAVSILKKLFAEMSDKELTTCFLAASETKSVLLGLLLAKQEINVAEAFKAAFLEELFQNKYWGEDAAAYNAREKVKQQLEQLERYLKN